MYTSQITRFFPSRMLGMYFKEVVIAQNSFRTSLLEVPLEPKGSCFK